MPVINGVEKRKLLIQMQPTSFSWIFCEFIFYFWIIDEMIQNMSTHF